MWQQRQRQLSILVRRSLRWKFDGCERGTAVDSVAPGLVGLVGEGQLAVQCPKELTSGLFGALAQADALPRRWHLDGRWGTVRTTDGDSNVRLLPLTQEAAVAVRNCMAGKPCHSRYLTPSVLEYLQKEKVCLTSLLRPDSTISSDKQQNFHLPKIEDRFTFAELFAGLGGFRLGLEAIGGQCVFASEINKHARELYTKNFHHEPEGDIRVVQDVPDHDLLVAGFPCQPFSSLGSQQGLADERGKLFEQIVRVLRLRHPCCFLLENVPGLAVSNKGRDLAIIREALEDAGYAVFCGIVNARNLTAQQRKRLFLVGFHGLKLKSEALNPFEFPDMPDMGLLAEDVLDFDLAGDDAHSISDRQLEQLRTQTRMSHTLAWADRKVETLIAHYSVSVGRGQSQLVPRWAPYNPRLFTPRECARIMGFPESYQLGDAMDRRQCKALYPLLGNAVCPPVIAALAAALQRWRQLPGRAAARAMAIQATRKAISA